MIDLTISLALELLCTFIFVATLTWYFYYLYCFTYWKKKNVPTITPQFPAGNITKSTLGLENLFLTIENCYNEFRRKGHKHGGLYFFNGPVYLPVDPEIVKSVLTTDFEHFVDRGMFTDEKNYPLSANLFSNEGLKWKNLRNKLSPVFTSGKMKTMYEIFLKMTENFINTVERRVETNDEINIKSLSANFTADIIFSTAFGLESDTLKHPDNQLSKIALNLFNIPTWNFIQTLIIDGLQNPGNLIKASVKKQTNDHFFKETLEKTIKHRDENNVTRKDFLSLLLEIRNKDGLSFNEIWAQSFLFFLAGFETSSQTISFCIHEMAHNQEYQDKLRKEIWDTLGQDFRNYTYENIFKLSYLDKVFNETLRLYPVLGFFNRICVKSYEVPGTNVVIEKGTPVLIPVFGLQRDPEYFPDPLKFDPERFSAEQNVVPFTFLPFGEGPRICIGMRYGKLQAKLGIAALISKFKFYPSPSTPKTIKFDKFTKSLSMVPAKGISVKAVKVH